MASSGASAAGDSSENKSLSQSGTGGGEGGLFSA
jgi:hypothetical protein